MVSVRETLCELVSVRETLCGVVSVRETLCGVVSVSETLSRAELVSARQSFHLPAASAASLYTAGEMRLFPGWASTAVSPLTGA